MWKNSFLIVLSTLFLAVSCNQQPRQLVILHTNDCHSRVEPTKKNLGGYKYRKQLIDSIRANNSNMLLLDAGDLVQGTPYFNIYGGQVEVEAYNSMGYDAITFGNHEFDNGVERLAEMLAPAKFNIVNSNYDVSNTPLDSIVKKYVVFDKNGLRVGVMGLSPNPENLILPCNFVGITFNDPIETTNYYAQLLKESEKCDFVIVLSHLGFSGTGCTADSLLATQTRNVDLILGGHTHDVHGIFRIANLDGDTVTVAQSSKSCEDLTKTVIEY